MPKKIFVPDFEGWDELNNRFVYKKGGTIVIEHSLVAMAKWESKWHKPLLSDERKTREQLVDYVRCMTISQNVKPELYECITDSVMAEVDAYMNDPMTATWFNRPDNKGKSKRVLTAELLYYFMISFNVPMECQKWHLNRLITLIEVCSEENKPQKKKSLNDAYRSQSEINRMRRVKLHSKG